MSRTMAEVNKLLEKTAGLINKDTASPFQGKVRVGVDLGTADIQTIVLDANGNPLAGYMDWANVVRDGVVVDFFGASQIVREQVRRASEKLGITIEHVTTSFPPGTDSRISTNVIEAAGLEVADVIDEPSSVARLLQLDHAAVVDIGGGTTGTAIIEKGEVVCSRDDATGGRHITLTLAGHFGIPFEEAEEMKRATKDLALSRLASPVIAKMADIVRSHIADSKVPAIYLTGGSCALPGFLEAFAAEFPDIEVVLPSHPLYLTPLAIASYSSALQAKAARVG
ncbi:ethanolamine utilization protein EutJ [Marinobacter salexigens]|uniref:ethanolamine utilization protein EutJ n=1 Tax=Marinobacter salexigens TaxID=1925763 RepID=UPI000C293267|nr:ethanolamine utilization protein EutJ [Marinobacter salexigens]